MSRAHLSGLVRFSYVCTLCKAAHDEAFMVWRGCALPECAPEGWLEIKGRIICPAHKILIDGEAP